VLFALGVWSARSSTTSASRWCWSNCEGDRPAASGRRDRDGGCRFGVVGRPWSAAAEGQV